MKKIISILLTVMMLFACIACGDKEDSFDPDLGLYEGESATYLGMTLSIQDLYSNGFSFELKAKGKCTVNADGTEASGKWSVENGVFTAKAGGVEFNGTLKDGTLYIEDMQGMGVDITFVNNSYSANLAAAQAAAQAATEDSGKAAKEDKKSDKKTDKRADKNTAETYYTIGYAAGGYEFGAEYLEMTGMGGTELTLNPDGSGKVIFKQDGTDDVEYAFTWTKDGKMKSSGVEVFNFEKTDDTTLKFYPSTATKDMYYIMSSDANATVESGASDDGTAEALDADITVTAGEPEPAAVSAGATGEPTPKGDGMASEEAILRMLHYYMVRSDKYDYPTYEELVAVVGVEAKDGGNDGPDFMSEKGTHKATWYVDEMNYIRFDFRPAKDDETKWITKQWMANGSRISRENAAEVDISDLIS